MFINNRDQFLLLENIKQAKQYLRKIGIEFEGNKKGFIHKNNKNIFNHVIDKLKKFPNLVYTFIKILYKLSEDPELTDELNLANTYVTDDDIQEFDRIIDWITDNKQIVNQLPKNIVKYTSLEELSDDIVQLGLKRKVDKFKKSLYRSMKNKIKGLGERESKKFNDLALQFMELDESYRNQFTPLKFFEFNNISFDEFVESLEQFINREDVNKEKKRILKYIEDNKIDVTFDENNVIAIQTNDKKHICNLGSQKWCIVYQADYYHNTYIGDKTFNTQYIIYNFNLPNTNSNSMFGITIRPNGEIHGAGTSQNKNNNPVPLDDIYQMAGIPKGTLTSLHKDKYEKINKEAVQIKDSLVNGNFINFAEVYNKIKDRKELFGDNRDDPFGVNLSVRNMFISWIERHDKITDVLVDINQKYDSRSENVNKLRFGKELLDDFENSVQRYQVKSIKTKEMVNFDEINEKDNKVYNFSHIFTFYKTLSVIILNSIVPEDVLYFIDNTFRDKDTSINSYIDIDYINHFIFKRGWSEFVEYLSMNEESETMRLILQISNYRDYVPNSDFPGVERINDLEISITDYKKIIEIESISDHCFRDYVIKFLINDDKIDLVKSGDYHIFSGFSNILYKKLSDEYLSKLDIEEVCSVINKMGKESSVFIEEFELNVMGMFLSDKDINAKIDIRTPLLKDPYTYVIKYPYLFKTLKETFQLRALIDENTSLKDKIKIEWSMKSIVNSNSSIDFGNYSSNELVSVWDNIDKIVSDLVSDINGSGYKISASPEKMEEVLLKKIKGKVFEIINERVENENSSNNDRFKTFDEYYKSVKKLIPILVENGHDGSLLSYIDIGELVGYWSKREENNYIGNNDSLFPEVSLIDFVIDSSGPENAHSVLDLLDSNNLYDSSSLSNKPYLKLCANIIEKSEIKIDNITPNGVLFALSEYGESEKYNYTKLFKEAIGLEYDKKNKVWIYETDYEALGNYYDEPFNFEDDDINYDSYNDYEAHDDGYVHNLDLGNIEKFVSYFKSVGFSIDSSPLDKYTIYKMNKNGYNAGMSYKESMKHYRDDKDLYNLVKLVEDIITEKYEDGDRGEDDLYADIDIIEIQNIIDSAYGSADSDARRDQFWGDQVEKLNTLFNYWPDTEDRAFGRRMLKWSNDNSGVFVIPNDELFNSIDLYYISTEFDQTNSFKMDDIINSFLEDNGKLDWAQNDGYASWSDDNYEYFNERISDSLYDIKGVTENIDIIKFENFKMDDRFISEFGDKKTAKEDLEYYTQTINELQKNGGQVYRMIFLKGVDSLNTEELGEHWCLEETQLSNFYESLRGEREENELPYLITGHLKPGQINEDYSFIAYKELPNELEINLNSDPEKYDIKPYTDTQHAENLWSNNL